MQLCLKCLVLQMILQNRRLRHFYFFRNILEPVRLRIFDWIFRILQVVHRILNNCRRKSILRECSGYLVFDVPVRKQVQQKRRWNDETACGQSNMDNQNNSNKDNTVNDVTNGTDRNNNTDQNDTLGDDMENLGDDVRDGANDTVDGIQEGADDVIDGVQRGANDVVDGVQNGMDAGENNRDNTNTNNEKTNGTENQKNQ